MPTIKSAKKRLRQAERSRERNRRVRSEIRTRTRSLLAMESPAEASEALRKVTSLLDRAARRHVMSRNAASRQKSRLTSFVAGLGK
ncbi:MAG: 30S ribosomal protein S20 [Gemmatimonadota bacterium]